MTELRTTCLRFNIAKPVFRRAWEILQTDTKSHSKLIDEALIEYHERHSRLAEDPYFETREREEKFAEDIVSAVSDKIEKAMPNLLAACFVKVTQPYGSPPPTAAQAAPNSPTTVNEDIDYSFLGE